MRAVHGSRERQGGPVATRAGRCDAGDEVIGGPVPAAPGVELWWMRLDVPAPVALTPAEQQRAAALIDPMHRARWCTARSAVRRILAAQLACAPLEVRIEAGPRGKPRVAGGRLRFNDSRSRDLAVCAVSWSAEVGVDVEAISPAVEVEAIARRFFSPAEQRIVTALEGEPRRAAFFAHWTAKEAYLKGVGTGLVDDLAGVDLAGAWPGPLTFDGWTVTAVGHPTATPPRWPGRPARRDRHCRGRRCRHARPTLGAGRPSPRRRPHLRRAVRAGRRPGRTAPGPRRGRRRPGRALPPAFGGPGGGHPRDRAGRRRLRRHRPGLPGGADGRDARRLRFRRPRHRTGQRALSRLRG